MKKQLLMMAAAFMGVAGSAYAYNIGDAVYTHSGKYKIVGENIVVNGDFSNGTTGWTGLTGGAIPTDTFNVVPNGGPDGKPCLQVMMSGGTMGNTLDGSANFRQSVRLAGGNTYVISYKVKANTGGVTSTARWSGRNDNYQDVFVNGNGLSPYPTETEDNKSQGSVAEWIDTKGDEWMTINYAYRAETDIYLNFEFFNLIQFDSFADFGVYSATQVGDDRIATSAANTLQSIIDDTETFPDAADYLSEPLAELRSAAENPDISVDELNGMVDMIMGSESALSEYLNAISADVSSYFDYFTFDDCTEKKANKGAAEGWSETGGRWGVRAPWSDMTTRHIFAESPANVAMAAGSQYQTAALPKGKYLYMVKGSGTRYYGDGSGKNSNFYIPDYYNNVSGMGFFINGDSAEMKDVPTYMSNIYYKVFDVAEDGDQTIGFYRDAQSAFTGNDRNKVSGSGIVRFDNMHIRILGVTNEDVEAYFLKETLANSQNALKVMVDSAKNVVALTKYIWGKDELQAVINESDNVYATCTNPTQEDIDKLDAQMPIMRDAIRAYYAVNKEYVQLGEDIEAAKEVAADAKRPAGKDALNAAIKTAEDYYTPLNASSVRDSLTLVKTDSTLNAAVQTFYVANASWETPAVMNLVNADFADNSTGWSIDAIGGTASWKFGTIDGVGRTMYFNRGNTAYDNKYAYQDVKVEQPGVYEFFATLAVHNSKWSSIEGQVTSTYLYANKDSIEVCTLGPGEPTAQVVGSFDDFSVVSKVTDINDTEQVPVAGYIRVGLEKRPLPDGTNAVVNMIYIANTKLLYYGSIEDYETGVTDVEVVDTTFDVYNLNGMKVRSNVNSLDGLAKGIYIVNGKKYVVK